MSVTQEVKNAKGRSFWVKVGITSQHRDDETTEDAYGRVTNFVIDRVTELTEEYLS